MPLPNWNWTAFSPPDGVIALGTKEAVSAYDELIERDALIAFKTYEEVVA